MQTAVEAAIARKLALKDMFANVTLDGPFAGQVLFELFDRVALYDPIDRRFMVALPDYTTKRPSDEEAIAYARSLFVDGAYDDGDGWRCGTILSVVASPSPEAGEVVDVTLTFDMYGEVRISVWYERNDAGKRVVYGEW